MNVEEFYRLLHEALGTEEDGREILLRPKMKVYINEDFVRRNKEKFLEGIRDLNDALNKCDPRRTLKEGLSYINIAGCPDYQLEQREALILVAIGKILGLWDIFPDPEMMPELFLTDTVGMFPMTTGLKVKI